MTDNELRDRLARYLAGADGHAWDDVFPRVPWKVLAENVIAEIEQAGYVVMSKKRLTTLVASGGCMLVLPPVERAE